MFSMKKSNIFKLYSYKDKQLDYFNTSLFRSFSTGTKNSAEPYVMKQFIDSEQAIEQKVNVLQQLINKATYPIFFTGAGISTSLGIPDYRSGHDTIIKTGAGLWNRSEAQVKKIQQQKNMLTDQLIPSITHMSIHTLIKNKTFKHLVSQNTDGLHLRSGVNKSNLSELHGNKNLQFCVKCQKKYLRDFRTIRKTQKHLKPGQKRDHFTGRSCQNCHGELHDSIIYFGQSLSKDQLIKSYQQGANSDLCIAVGSSLTVKPSSNVPLLPMQYNKQGKLVIINIQETPLDVHASLKMNGFCDQIFKKLMKKLHMKILPYLVQRYLYISLQKQYWGWSLQLKSLDEFHYNYSYIKNVQIVSNNTIQQIQQQETTSISNLKNKFNFNISLYDHENLHHIKLKVKFFRPSPDLVLDFKKLIKQNDIIGREDVVVKICSQNNGQWNINRVNQ